MPSSPIPGTADRPLVEVHGLVKHYGGVTALADVDLDIRAGEIHAVVGENGAGKSTLMKILAGSVVPDAGSVALDGAPLALGSPAAARANGIGIVYQELSLFPDRSVLANLFVNAEPTRAGLVDRRAMVRRAAPVLARVGLELDLHAPVGGLSVGERQLIELCRVLLEQPRLLVLDEPNSALNEAETRRLFTVLRELSASGITILYVSHRLEEVLAIADRITVMRNARRVLTRPRAELTIPQVVEAMVGGRQAELFPPRSAPTAGSHNGSRVALEVRDLTVGDSLRGISFRAPAGEILGLAGLEGSGVGTLLGVLFGTVGATAGTVEFPDGGGLPASPTAAARRRISLVPADRRRQGLMLERSLAANVAHVAVGTLPGRTPWLRARSLASAAERQIRALHIRTPSPWASVDHLSGGNQQKVVVGKWLEIGPRVILLDDPTRGVDIGAKREIYLLIRRLAGEGRIVIFRSTELPELIGLADRILVLFRGRLAGELMGDEIDDATLLHAVNTGQLGRTA